MHSTHQESVDYELLAQSQRDAQQPLDRRANSVLCLNCQCLTRWGQRLFQVTRAFGGMLRRSPRKLETGSVSPGAAVERKKGAKAVVAF